MYAFPGYLLCKITRNKLPLALIYYSMSEIIERYKLGDIEVVVESSATPAKVVVTCTRADVKAQFEAREYEFKNYRRLMNLRIKEAFDSAE